MKNILFGFISSALFVGACPIYPLQSVDFASAKEFCHQKNEGISLISLCDRKSVAHGSRALFSFCIPNGYVVSEFDVAENDGTLNYEFECDGNRTVQIQIAYKNGSACYVSFAYKISMSGMPQNIEQGTISAFCTPMGKRDYYSLVSAEDSAYFAYESDLSQKSSCTSYTDFQRRYGPLRANSMCSEEPSRIIDPGLPIYGDMLVRGDVYWKDGNPNSISHSLRNAAIRLWFGSNSAFFSTDLQGHFEDVINPNLYLAMSGTCYAEICAKGGGAEVVNASGAQYSCLLPVTLSFDPINSYLDVSTITLSDLNCSSDLLKAYSVHQACELSTRHATEMHGTTVSGVKIVYPKATNQYLPVSQNNQTAQIHIKLGNAYDWDVIMHEYGHHAAFQIGFGDASLVQDHSSFWCLNATYGKLVGTRLAWSEGWATYFSISAQVYQQTLAYNLTNVGDSTYQDSLIPSINYSISNPDSSHSCFGESQESVVSSTLYNLSTHSYFTDGFEFIWNLLEDYHPITVSEFINNLINECGEYVSSLLFGNIFADLSLGPSIVFPGENISISNLQNIISWSPQGGSGDFANNSFDIVFYNDAGQAILTKTGITNPYVGLNSNDISTLGSQNGAFIALTIKGFQNYTINSYGEYITGPYFSNPRLISLI